MQRKSKCCVFFLFLWFCTTTLAFRPPELSEELGCSPTLSLFFRNKGDGLFYFDPLSIATDANFGRLREAELKHGRVAMTAVVATVLPPILKATDANVDWIPKNYSYSIVESFKSLTMMDFAKVVITCGFLEAFIFVQRDPKDMPGDYGTGYFGVINKQLHERNLVSELENGRLAMIAIVYQVVAELVTGEPWFEQWRDAFEKLSKL